MKASELMIGDWIRYGSRFGIVKGIKTNTCLILVSCNGNDELIWETFDNIESIPLTPEILEKNGFIYESKDQLFKDIYPRISMLYAQYRLIENGYINYGEMPEIKYVHQLQHALKLCHIEKTIEL